jgi:hypothetical protein
LTHSLKAPGFNPRAYQVKKTVSKFAFKWVNLYRYNAAVSTAPASHLARAADGRV